MKFESEATIVAEFLRMAMQGALVRGAKPIMWSPVERTALAEAEVEYYDRKVPVIWVNWGNRADLMNISPALRHVYNASGRDVGLGDPVPASGAPVLQKDSWGAAVIDELDIDDSDIRVDKYRMSGFWDTPLDSILRNLDVRTCLFAGVNADQCVLHTLADANFLGYDTILLEDCTATTSPDFCWQATLYNARQIFGFTAVSTDLIPALEDQSHASVL